MNISGIDTKGGNRRDKPGKGSLRSEIRLIRYVWISAKGIHHRILLPMAAQVIIGLFPASVTYYIQAWVSGSERVGGLLNARHILALLGLILGLTVVKQLSGLAQGYAMADVRRRLERRYVSFLSGRRFAATVESGSRGIIGHRSLMAFTRESEMLTGLIPMVYRSFIQAPLTIVSFLALMVWLSWQLSLVMLILVGAVVYCCMVLRKKVKTTRNRLYGRMADLYQTFSDWLKGERVMRFYDTGGFISGKLYLVVDDSCVLNKRLVRISCIQGVAVELLTYVGVVAFMMVLGMSGDRDQWRILLTYPLAIMYIRSEAIKVVQGYSQLAATESSVCNLDKALELERDEAVKREVWTAKIDEIELRGVDFSYTNGRHVLSGGSAVFRADGLNVVAGESGAGKSTCLDIISMSLMPDKGMVLLSGKDNRKFDRRSVAARMSIVEQEPFLFEGTFHDNLTFGNVVDEEEILEKCRELRLEHVIGCRQDLYKNVEDDGGNLSVGEKQRLVFIRALLKKPDVILLDEATSAVDRETATVMMDCLKRYARKMVVICVSHDPQVINKADHLVFIKNGRLVTHEKDEHTRKSPE